MRAPWLPCLLAAGTAMPQVVSLPPVADTTADALSSTVPLGSQPEIRLGSHFLSIPWLIHLRGYLQFDLGSVGGLGVPVRATLYWHQSQILESGPARVVTAHRVTASWSENTLTWSNKPADDPSILATNSVGPGTGLGWKTWDLTGLVQDWLAGAQPNFGVVLRHPTETNGDLATGVGPSRENATATLRPFLEIDFGSTFGSGCATGGGVPVLIFAAGAPAPGSSFTLRTTGCVAGSLPAMVMGTSNTTWSGTSLPLSLAAAGFPTCQLLVAPEARTVYAPTAGTTFDVVLAVPGAANLVGLPLFAQTGAFGPAGTLQLSNGFGLAIY